MIFKPKVMEESCDDDDDDVTRYKESGVFVVPVVVKERKTQLIKSGPAVCDHPMDPFCSDLICVNIEPAQH